MQPLTCKICNGNELVVDGDYLVCQYCGTRYTMETARKMLGSVRVEGVVQTRSADFDIKAGELLGYSGASRNVVVPDGVVAIGSRVFQGTGITSVKLPESVTRIKSRAFEGCGELAQINLPRNLQTIEGWAFIGCKSLATIAFPVGLKEILAGAFGGCGLTSLSIPPGISTIDEGVFNNMRNLTTLSIPGTVKSIGSRAFADCRSLRTLVIGQGTCEIGWMAFSECVSLVQVQLPTTLTTIRDNAFGGCTALQSILIPGSVTKLGCNAFAGCKSLVQAAIYNPNLVVDESVFSRTPIERMQRQQAGVCLHCGGEFRGYINKVCIKCGKRKDY